MPLFDEHGNEVPEPDESQALKDARAAAERGAGATKEAEKLARENAFLRALPQGFDATPLGKMFAESYKGDLTTEAIQAAATEIGLLEVTAEPVEPTDAELQAQREALRQGITPPKTQAQIDAEQKAALDPRYEGIKEFRKAIEEDGVPREDASAQFFDRVVTAAHDGDQRVIWTAEKHQQLVNANPQRPA